MKWEDLKAKREIRGHKGVWMKTDIACPKCGKPIHRRVDIVLLSNPPAYHYICEECGWRGTA